MINNIKEFEEGKRKRKKIKDDNFKAFSFCYSHKGRRHTLEDAHIILERDECAQRFPELCSKISLAIYGILDGHGGRRVADFVASELPIVIADCLLTFGDLCHINKNVTAALMDAFLLVDKKINEKFLSENWTDGCCCVLVLIVNNIAHIANLGDSRAVLCRRLKADAKKLGTSTTLLPNHDVSGAGVGKHALHSFPWDNGERDPPPAAEALALTVDHRPILVTESARIRSCGGDIVDGRIYVNGVGVGVSRSFGDCALKRLL